MGDALWIQVMLALAIAGPPAAASENARVKGVQVQDAARVRGPAQEGAPASVRSAADDAGKTKTGRERGRGPGCSGRAC